MAVVLFSVVTVQAAPHEADIPPEEDFLEFLGSWTTGESRPKWIDPFQLEEPTPFDEPSTAPATAGDRRAPSNRQQSGDTPTKEQGPDFPQSDKHVKP